MAACISRPISSLFLDDHPRIDLRLDLSDDYVDLIESRADLAIRIAADPGVPGLTARRLAPNRRILCAAPAYLERFGTPRRIADLKQHACSPPTASYPGA